MVTNYVIDCIINNIKPEFRKSQILDKESDRYDFVSSNGNRRSSIECTLKDMYEAYGVRFKMKKSLVEGTNHLIKENLVEVVVWAESLFFCL